MKTLILLLMLMSANAYADAWSMQYPPEMERQQQIQQQLDQQRIQQQHLKMEQDSMELEMRRRAYEQRQ